uniref:Ion transport domain-containing protein n=1 Tax=Timema monikensis TaxID=170555 RepID=A0A7R9E334_9NEOP|nr:unnamed protein product [Timema monikensis]
MGQFHMREWPIPFEFSLFCVTKTIAFEKLPEWGRGDEEVREVSYQGESLAILCNANIGQDGLKAGSLGRVVTLCLHLVPLSTQVVSYKVYEVEAQTVMRLLISEYQYARSELPELETPGTPKLLSAKTLGDLEQGNVFGFPATSPYQNPLEYLQRTITEQAIKIQQRLGQPKLLRSDSQKEKGKDGEIYFMDKLYGWMSLHPESYAYILWLIVVSMAFLYNCWVVPLRSTFLFRNPENLGLWFTVDCCADAIYLLDLMVVKPRIMYLLDGFWIHDTKLTTGKYMRKLQFKMDVFSLLPTDLLYLKFGRNSAWLRLPRFLKIQTFWELYDRLDNILPSGFNVRVARSVVYVLYMIHINACAYYLFSFWREPGGSVTSGKGSAYIQCFYFATKTTTAMGRNPKPDTVEGTVFMSFSWLLGVFVFAILIGQMREHVGTATHLQTEYRNLVDGTLEYMRRFNLPNRLQDKVKLWLAFTSQQQHSLGLLDN